MSAEHDQALEKDVGPAAPIAAGPTIAAVGPNGAPNVIMGENGISRFDYGPLSHVNTKEAVLRPFGGEFQPGLYKSVETRKLANPAPLGLSAFALTTFVLSCINMAPATLPLPTSSSRLLSVMVVWFNCLPACGVWFSREMAVGNTFGATALSSYGGFWLAFAIVLTPGGFNIEQALITADGDSPDMFYNSFGLFLLGWFIFTTILLFCTLRSTVAFFLLFFFLDLTFLLLGIGYIQRDASGAPNPPVIKAGGFFGLMAAFAAWYNALAGIADSSNSFFIIPVAHFPWSPTGRTRRQKTERETA
ncbi:hypothetical protein ARAM_006167 [Aspergillus rambellii]|uniref:GPR/FUN34 family protein n=2 Tax=Aspergillus subgen. Nidulantes TaxID=2720870 RepID=A0A0F8UVK5_9EURO|nr:hypothetical protein ARAM_006167 [Aspergillus rambellii]KKK24093.1 hypothetical protein AOCH_006967 [Aspergillus ochraceoroseus]